MVVCTSDCTQVVLPAPVCRCRPVCTQLPSRDREVVESDCGLVENQGYAFIAQAAAEADDSLPRRHATARLSTRQGPTPLAPWEAGGAWLHTAGGRASQGAHFSRNLAGAVGEVCGRADIATIYSPAHAAPHAVHSSKPRLPSPAYQAPPTKPRLPARRARALRDQRPCA